MPVKIENIQKKSLFSQYPLRKGAILFTINQQHLEDILDFYYLIENNQLCLEYQNPGEERKTIEIVNHFDKPVGIELQAPVCRQCINHCIFCFIDQMPKNMRNSLYIKDDDFVFSFLYGNFITLTNLTDYFIEKIIRLNISPLYVSVHTTNPLLHQKMLRYPRSFNIMETLNKLAEHDIRLHTQIVLVPEWNDGIELRRSLNDLTQPGLSVDTIGIVPVGLTGHRQELSELRLFSKEECQDIIEISEQIKQESGFEEIYCADEIFLKAEQPIPAEDYYHDFCQIENGIGLIRLFWMNWKKKKARFISFLSQSDKPVIFITGKSGKEAIKPIVEDINKKISNKATFIEISNQFFGETVTVSGLLTWTDIRNQVSFRTDYLYIFSSNFFNYENKTLDDYTQEEIIREIGSDILIVDELFENWAIKKVPEGT